MLGTLIKGGILPIFAAYLGYKQWKHCQTKVVKPEEKIKVDPKPMPTLSEPIKVD